MYECKVLLQLKTFAFVWWHLHISRCQYKVQETTGESYMLAFLFNSMVVALLAHKALKVVKLGSDFASWVFDFWDHFWTHITDSKQKPQVSFTILIDVSLMKSLWLVFQKIISSEYAAFEWLSVEVFAHMLYLWNLPATAEADQQNNTPWYFSSLASKIHPRCTDHTLVSSSPINTLNPMLCEVLGMR